MKNHLTHQPTITPFLKLLTPMRANSRVFFQNPFIYVSPRPIHALPSQGFKLRVNTQWDDLPRALPLVSAVCKHAKHAIGFKFLADLHLAEMSQSKKFPPSAAGKLITIYPHPEKAEKVREVFEDLDSRIQRLSPALAPAPCPISDFPLTKNVSYRYGSFTDDDTLVSPDDGTRSQDCREYFQLPPWAEAEDPFSEIRSNSGTTEEVDEEGNVLLGNYIVKTCLHRTFVGAVYAGVTRTGVDVCVKEARPYTKFDGILAADRLTSEFKTLSHVYYRVGKEICPKPIEIFQHHGHRFLVMERIRGSELLNWRHRNNNFKPSEIGESEIGEIACSFVKLISKIQKAKIAWVDISPSNIIVTDEAAPELRLIDAEHAILANSDELRFDVERLGKMLLWLANPIDTLWNNQEPIRPEDVDQYIHGMPPGYRRVVTAALAGEPINKISEHLSEIEQTPDNGSK